MEPEPLPEEPTDTDFLEVDGGSNDIRRYFGFTEATEAELHKIASLLYQEFLPDKRPSADDERRVFLYCMEQIGRGADCKIEFPERRKELLAYAFTSGLDEKFDKQSRQQAVYALVLKTPQQVKDSLKDYGTLKADFTPTLDGIGYVAMSDMAARHGEGLHDGRNFDVREKLEA